tara:strand:- start:243 stop:395 length:153 start_codon:yes stop_codon:yes gene_type:complete
VYKQRNYSLNRLVHAEGELEWLQEEKKDLECPEEAKEAECLKAKRKEDNK